MQKKLFANWHVRFLEDLLYFLNLALPPIIAMTNVLQAFEIDYIYKKVYPCSRHVPTTKLWYIIRLIEK